MKRKVVRQGGSLMVSIPAGDTPFKEGDELTVSFDRGKLTYSLGDLGRSEIEKPELKAYSPVRVERKGEVAISPVPFSQPVARQPRITIKKELSPWVQIPPLVEKPVIDGYDKAMGRVADLLLGLVGFGSKIKKRESEKDYSI